MDGLCYHRLFTLELDLGYCQRHSERQKISTLLRPGRIITYRSKIDSHFHLDQITSLFSAMPPLLSIACLLSLKRKCLYAYIKAIPKSFCEEIRFLVLGSNNPWENHISRHYISKCQASTANQWAKRRFWVISEVLSNSSACHSF